jgi:hypothetical protein
MPAEDQNQEPRVESTPEVESPAPVVAPDPAIAAQAVAANQRVEALQGQIAGLQNQLGQVAQTVMAQRNAEYERELAELPPAERAERRAQQAQQQVAYLTQQLNQRSQGASEAEREAYFRRRSGELEQEVNSGVDDAARVKIAEVPANILSAGEAATETWMKSEVARRKTEASRKKPVDTDDERVDKAVRKALTEAGVAGPVGARAAATTSVEAEDFRKVAWRGVLPGDKHTPGPGRSLGLHGRGQGAVKKELAEMRERAYAEAGLSVP